MLFIAKTNFVLMLAFGPLRDVAHALVTDATAEHQLAVVAFGTLLEGTEHHCVREAIQYLEEVGESELPGFEHFSTWGFHL